MLQIFADALLIASRMDTPGRPDHRRRPDPREDTRRNRAWMSLSGLRR